MKKLKLLLIPLLLTLSSCGTHQDNFVSENKTYTSQEFSKYEPFIVDGKNYKWTILSQEEGKLLIYDVDKVEVKYKIDYDYYKIVYVNDIPSGVAYLFDYYGYRYLLAVGI